MSDLAILAYILIGVDFLLLVTFIVSVCMMFRRRKKAAEELDPNRNVLSNEEKMIRAVRSENRMITRKEIAANTRAMNDNNISVLEHPENPQLPMSLKWKTKTYAMIYGIEDGLLLIVRISVDYANEIDRAHINIQRAKFPKGANWFDITVDDKFCDRVKVNEILTNARMFVQTKPVPKPTTGQGKPAAAKPTGDKAQKPAK